MRFPSRAKPTTSARLLSPPPPPSSKPKSKLPPARAAPWRSLWSRVYGQWATTPAPAASTQVFAQPKPKPNSNANSKSEDDDVSIAPSMTHAGLRAYLQRKRGELWFLTKRRQDCELRVGSDADEVEVAPPPLAIVPESPVPVKRLLRHPVEITNAPALKGARVSEFSDLEVGMSSYSDSSSCSSSSDSDDAVLESTRAATRDDDDGARDSYGRTTSASDDEDPFLRRYSSWCSIDEEQTARSSGDHQEEDETSRKEEGEEQGEGEGDAEGQSPTLEALYGVYHVGAGNPNSEPEGIWV